MTLPSGIVAGAHLFRPSVFDPAASGQAAGSGCACDCAKESLASLVHLRVEDGVRTCRTRSYPLGTIQRAVDGS